MTAMYATSTFVVELTLAAPSGLAAAAVAGGGTFANVAQFWVITFTNATGGETTVSNEVTATPALNGHVNLTWTAPPSGTGNVKVYRGTVTATENVLVQTLAGNAAAYTDTGSAGTAGSPPASNSAGIATHTVMEGSLRDSTHPAVGAAGALFSASPPVTGKGHVSAAMGQYLAAYPAGP